MNICIYVCIRAYFYVRTCKYANAHMHAYIHTRYTKPGLVTYLHVHSKCLDTYMHAYIMKCMNALIHIWVLTNHMFICAITIIYTYVHTYIHACIHACVCVDIGLYIHTYIHTYIHAYMHVRVDIGLYIHTYIHTYMHTCIHACVC